MSSSARHVAIIMDGNARWAKERSLTTLDGHQAGAKALKRTVEAALKHDLSELTVYAFSTENWARPDDEVAGLMEMFAQQIAEQTPELQQEGVKMLFIGRREGLSEALLQKMRWAEQETAGNDKLKLFVAFNYGGRTELIDAARSFNGSEDDFAAHLYAPQMNDPDLVIRTSGERRLSNFLLWQTAYSELYFTDLLWPDFGEPELARALADFEQRRRRFGTR